MTRPPPDNKCWVLGCGTAAVELDVLCGPCRERLTAVRTANEAEIERIMEGYPHD